MRRPRVQSVLLWCSVLLLAGARVEAQSDSLPAGAPAASVAAETALAAPQPPVPVFLGGRELLRVHVGREGLDVPARAAAIRSRLAAAVADAATPADSVRLVTSTAGLEVRHGARLLYVLEPGDLPSADAAVNRTWIAQLVSDTRAGIARERASREPLRQLAHVGLAVAITLAAWLLFLLIARLGSAWRGWLHRRVQPHIPAVNVRGAELLSGEQLGGALLGVLGRADLVLHVLLLFAWLTAVFSRFPWTQSWSWQLQHLAWAQLAALGSGVVHAVPGLLVVALVLFVFQRIVAFADAVFERIAEGRLHLPGFHPELARPSRRLARAALWLIGIVVAYPYLPGSDSRAVQGVSVFLGLMISLGSSSVIGNLIAGLVLTYSRAFSIGDRVRIGEHVGDVVALGTFATKLRSLRNEEIALPNSVILSGPVLNYTRHAGEGGLWLHTQVTIGYDVDWRKVHALLSEAALAVPGVEAAPAPIVYQRALNDYHVSYEITCMTRDSHAQLRLYSELHAAIQDAFSRAGVEILSPAYAALRDGNAQALPGEPGGPRQAPGGFRLRSDRD